MGGVSNAHEVRIGVALAMCIPKYAVLDTIDAKLPQWAVLENVVGCVSWVNEIKGLMKEKLRGQYHLVAVPQSHVAFVHAILLDRVRRHQL